MLEKLPSDSIQVIFSMLSVKKVVNINRINKKLNNESHIRVLQIYKNHIRKKNGHINHFFPSRIIITKIFKEITVAEEKISKFKHEINKIENDSKINNILAKDYDEILNNLPHQNQRSNFTSFTACVSLTAKFYEYLRQKKKSKLKSEIKTLETQADIDFQIKKFIT